LIRRSSRTQEGAKRVLPHFEQAVAFGPLTAPQASQIFRFAEPFFVPALLVLLPGLVRFVP
jgi:hypothetical protein